jgi:hypothetical protein
MQARAMIGALMAVTMLAAGCGEEAILEDEQPTMQTHEAAKLPYSYEIWYYDGPDFQHNYVVGIQYMHCNGPGPLNGTVTQYQNAVNFDSCGGGSWECPTGAPCF